MALPQTLFPPTISAITGTGTGTGTNTGNTGGGGGPTLNPPNLGGFNTTTNTGATPAVQSQPQVASQPQPQQQPVQGAVTQGGATAGPLMGGSSAPPWRDPLRGMQTQVA